MLQQEVDEYYARSRVSNSLLELRNLVQVVKLIIHRTMMHKENHGLHFTLDCPELLTHSGSSILSVGNHYINR